MRPTIRTIDVQAEEELRANTISEIACWGNDSEGQLGLDNYSSEAFYSNPKFIRYQINVVSLQCGNEHTILQSEMGNIYAMGSNKFGQIGLGPNVPKRATPTLIPFCKTEKAWNFAVGADHTLLYCSI